MDVVFTKRKGVVQKPSFKIINLWELCGCDCIEAAIETEMQHEVGFVISELDCEEADIIDNSFLNAQQDTHGATSSVSKVSNRN